MSPKSSAVGRVQFAGSFHLATDRTLKGGVVKADNQSREAAVLGTLLEAYPDKLTPYTAKLIHNAPESFDDLRHSLVAVAIRRTAQAGNPVHVTTIREYLPPEIDFSWLASLERDALPLALAEFEAEKLFESFRERQTKSIFDDASAALASAPDMAQAIVAGVRASLDRLEGETNSADALGARLTERRFNIHVKPAEPTPRYYIGSTPVCTPGNITAISAGIKSGKTSLLGAMLAAAVTPTPQTADCLGIKSRNTDGRAIIHFDTEQSIFDHHSILDCAMRRAGLSEPPPWLLSYCVTGFTVAELLLCLKLLLSQAQDTFGGTHSVLLDGVGDMVRDVNDPAECNAFVSELHAQAIKHHCPIIGAIHFNPGTEKTRGHLGSQLERKAETNLRLDKDGEAIVVWSEKNRRAPISKANGPRFTWSNEHKMHVSIASAGTARADAECAVLENEAADVFESAGKQALSWKEFIAGVRRITGIKTDSGARKRMEKMTAAHVITKDVLGHYILAK